MAEAPENGKELLHYAHANGMKCINVVLEYIIEFSVSFIKISIMVRLSGSQNFQ